MSGKGSGDYSISLSVSALNQQTVTDSQALTVNVPFWQNQSFVILIILLVVFFFIIVVVTRH